MGKRGFTLVELLNVVAIIAILSAIFWPVVKAARGAAFRYNAALSMKNLGGATDLYMADHDDTYPIAMSWDGYGFRAWFGAAKPEGGYDPKAGILSSYTNGRAARDLTHEAKEYMGDRSGFGYNWGYLGSDMNDSLDFSAFPNCLRPARASEISNPRSVVVFATSAYYFASWIPGGDGVKYDFGFIDPPKFWYGNPNVDFRHGDLPAIDARAETVTPKGTALFLMSSGAAKALSPKAVVDEMFERHGRSEDSE
ncbi:MAG TPA: type II secretion system protein [Fimbriimonadaceae bacterium]|nr:type II secretion system protein [Fimbriimonadaceae bacterium]